MLRRNNDLCQEEVVQLVLNSIYFFSLTFKNNARIKQISRMDVKVNHGNYESVDVVVVVSGSDYSQCNCSRRLRVDKL